MKKVYRVGLQVPVSTYKQALRQHAKAKLSKDFAIFKHPVGCIRHCGAYGWGFKILCKHGIYQGWKGLKTRSNFQ